MSPVFECEGLTNEVNAASHWFPTTGDFVTRQGSIYIQRDAWVTNAYTPLFASSAAVSFPMPALAPVTITTLPSILARLLQTPPFAYCLKEIQDKFNILYSCHSILPAIIEAVKLNRKISGITTNGNAQRHTARPTVGYTTPLTAETRNAGTCTRDGWWFHFRLQNIAPYKSQPSKSKIKLHVWSAPLCTRVSNPALAVSQTLESAGYVLRALVRSKNSSGGSLQRLESMNLNNGPKASAIGTLDVASQVSYCLLCQCKGRWQRNHWRILKNVLEPSNSSMY